MAYDCSLCGGKERAALLITPLSGADTMPVGQQCAALAYITLLASSLNVDTDKLYDHVMQLAGEGELTPERITLPTGYVYGPNGEDILSEDDVDAGLCGLIHDDWTHCHRKARHSGKHNSVVPGSNEAAQGPPVDAEALAGADGRAE